MDGFKNTTKIKYFKEGGSVSDFTKRDKKQDSSDIAQDKAIVKKAMSIHDKQEHPGEKTDLSTLKKGGRAKKELGNVRKFEKSAKAAVKMKTGGVVNVYEAKKKAGDLDSIQKVKDTKAVKLCNGKSVKKMAVGGGVMDDIQAIGTQLKNNVMGTPEQNRIAQARMDRIAARKAAEKAALLGGMGGSGALQQGALAGGATPPPVPAPANIGPGAGAPMPAQPVPPQAAGGVGPAGPVPMQKRGGKVKKAKC